MYGDWGVVTENISKTVKPGDDMVTTPAAF